MRATGALEPVGLALRGGCRERLGGRCTLKDRMDECNYVPESFIPQSNVRMKLTVFRVLFMVMSFPDVSCGGIVAVTFNSFIFRILVEVDYS
jgi:hypothetical protein